MEHIRNHINIHSTNATLDAKAVNAIKDKLTSVYFACDFDDYDTWPNIDGRFELCIKGEPQQYFYVQIKGTEKLDELRSGNFSYQLQDLAFLSCVKEEITKDPCILFVVENPLDEQKRNIYWRYISNNFLNSVDFTKSSKVIRFTSKDKIIDFTTFAQHMNEVARTHTIVQALENKIVDVGEVERHISILDNRICKEIDAFGEKSRDALSQEIYFNLKLFAQNVLLKCYGDGGRELNLKVAYEYAQEYKELRFLCRFLRFLNFPGVVSIPDDGQSERLMLKYYDYLWETREILKNNFNIKVLSNLENFPLDLTGGDYEYYQKVAESINTKVRLVGTMYNTRYYVKRSRPFYIGIQRCFEVTLELANKYATKHDRITVYTVLDMSCKYSINVELQTCHIDVWNTKVPIKVVTGWKVSIHPKALNKYASILGISNKISSNYKEYGALMLHLTQSGMNLVELIDLPDKSFDKHINNIYGACNTREFANVLESCRKIIKRKMPGTNVLRYLLYGLRERHIEDQLGNYNSKLSELYLEYGCISFDELPFTFSPLKHNPNFFDLIECLDTKDKTPHFLAQRVRSNAENRGILYTHVEELDEFGDINELIDQYNNQIWSKQRLNNKLMRQDGFVYINGYEKNTLDIIGGLKRYTKTGLQGYANMANAWIEKNPTITECKEKTQILKKLFITSKVALLYGSAGTGKTTLMEYVSNLFVGRKKIFLANTNSAVQNLKRRITTPGGDDRIMTIKSFLSQSSYKGLFEGDVLFIDECSTVSNMDMVKILEKTNFELLVLVGDTYQIESINFGNWFELAKDIVSPNVVFELSFPWRAKDNAILKNLWKRVRDYDDSITEELSFSGGKFSKKIDETIFKPIYEDEIILCLNYDGLYGINNINRYLQLSNLNKAIEWGMWTYKIGDPILFKESERFPQLYNNLKGRIANISIFVDRIEFTVEIDIVLTDLGQDRSGFKFISNTTGKSIISFFVHQSSNDLDDDDKEACIVPFQVAYAVSIHKSQGLEYDSVKVVITHDAEENISHNIFYTAITRAKKSLQIFWTPETQEKIISRFKPIDNSQEKAIIEKKLS